MNKANEKYFGKDLEAMSFAQNYHRWILEEIFPYLGPKTAEIGAGMGNFSEFLLESNNIEQMFSYEPDKDMFEILQDKFANNPRIETINDFFSAQSVTDKKLDSVVLINVLEHIEKDERALSEINSTMTDNGHLLIFVPALQKLFSETDRVLGHFRRYQKAELRAKVESAGFKIKKLEYFDFTGIFPWFFVVRVLKKDPLVSANVDLYDKLAIPIIKRFEKVFSPPIGKNLILIAQKK